MALGAKTGGRKKGVPNKRTAARKQLSADAVNAGLMPLEFMLQILRDPTAETKDRMWAAKEAAAYLHPKLAQIEHGNLGGKALQIALQSSDAGIV